MSSVYVFLFWEGGAVLFLGKNIPILDVSEGGMVERILMLGFMHSF